MEPWGELYQFEPGAKVDIVARGPDNGALEIEATDSRLVVYGWPGSVVELYNNGIKLTGAGPIRR